MIRILKVELLSQSLLVMAIVAISGCIQPDVTSPFHNQNIYFDIPVSANQVVLSFPGPTTGLSFNIKNPEKTSGDVLGANIFYQAGVTCSSSSYPHIAAMLTYSLGTWTLIIQYFSDDSITDPIPASPNGAGTWLLVIDGLSAPVTPVISGGALH
jgi:hypothetical protein